MPYVPQSLRPAGQNTFIGYDEAQDYLRTGGEEEQGFPQISAGEGELGGGGGEPGGFSLESVGEPVGQGLAPAAEIPGPEYPLFDRGAGSAVEGLFQPVRRETGERVEGVGSLRDMFMEEAGADRSFEGLGGSSILGGALNPQNAGLGNYMEEARGLLGASYKGPQGLNPDAASEIREQVEDTRAQAEALSTGGGLTSLLGLGVPGLTPGEAAFEAQRTLGQEGYREAARDLGFEAARPLGLLGQAETEATARAGERTAQEAGIASQSRDYLTGRRSEVTDDLERRVAESQTADEATRAAFAAAQSGDLSQLPGPLAEDFANTEGQKQLRDAQDLRSEIMERYADVAQYGPLEKRVTKRGREWYGILDEATGKVRDIRHTKGLDKHHQGRLVERQRELERLFGGDLGRKDDQEKTPYRDVAPLYFGEDFQPLDPREYIELEEGTGASRENLASSDERYVVNQVNTLLDEVDRISDAGEPYRAAQIAAELDRYMAAEEFALDQRAGELDEAEKKWRQTLRKARSRYKEHARRHSTWGDMMVVGSNTLSGGGLSLLGMNDDIRNMAP